YALIHEKDGLLAYQTPLSFIRTVKMSVGVGSRSVRVQAPKTDSQKSAAANYVVSEVVHEMPIQVGQQVPMPVPERISTAVNQRERAVQAERYHQTWFSDGQRDAALEYIRRRIRAARSEVLVADPYFGANQLMQFLHAVARTDISISILTSRLAFESQNLENSSKRSTQKIRGRPDSQRANIEVERLQAFEAAMQTFAARGIKKCSAFVLTGRSPPLHDRFLVIDNVVLFLGNSLNALGDKASLILDVPEPESIIKRLEGMLSVSTAFDTYKKSRVSQIRRRKDRKR
ncbi:MAG: VPA1262 family N-terminal domain-containing protein, partial [Sciscionella sp.]